MVTTFKNGNSISSMYAQGKKIRKAYKNGTLFFSTNIVLTNLLTNGSFETNTTGWTGSQTLTRVTKNPVHSEYGNYVGQCSGKVNGAIYIQRSSALTGLVSGRKYYIRTKAQSTIPYYAYQIQFMNNSNALSGFEIEDISNGTDNGWYLYDGIWTADSTSLTLRANFTGGGGNNNRTIQIDNIMIIDLTTPYGSGNEPSIDYLRDIVSSNNGYWDGGLSV